MKSFTKRDLAVIQCVLAYDPNVAGITIRRYVSTDRVAPEYVTAIVSASGLPEIRVKVRDEGRGQWTPISVSDPETVFRVLWGLGGVVLRKR